MGQAQGRSTPTTADQSARSGIPFGFLSSNDVTGHFAAIAAWRAARRCRTKSATLPRSSPVQHPRNRRATQFSRAPRPIPAGALRPIQARCRGANHNGCRQDFRALLVLVNPIGAIPIFIGLTPDASAQERKRIAKTASIAVAASHPDLCRPGRLLIRLLGISMGCFRWAAGFW